MASNYLRTALLGVSMLAISTSAQAADDWYVSGGAGLSILSDSDIKDTVTGVGSADGNVSYDNGFALTGAVGKSFGDFRVEGELSYRKNDLDTLTITSVTLAGQTFAGSASAKLTGDQSTLGFMANGYYDFNNDSSWTPFVMGGAGMARHNLDVKSVGGVATTYDETDTVFAYQMGVGVGYAVTEKADVTLQYRLFGTADATYDDGTDKIEGDYLNHSIMVGFTHAF